MCIIRYCDLNKSNGPAPKRIVPSGATDRSGGEFVDINAILLVMTERVEILTDGGSALYGTDAVAAVINVIMRTDFEGIEVYGDIQNTMEASGAVCIILQQLKHFRRQRYENDSPALYLFYLATHNYFPRCGKLDHAAYSRWQT